jgi:hypothetical protein
MGQQIFAFSLTTFSELISYRIPEYGSRRILWSERIANLLIGKASGSVGGLASIA